MSSFTNRARILLVVTAVLVGVLVWASSQVQRHGADVARQRQVEAQTLLTSMLDQETGVRGFLLTGQEEFLEPYVSGRQAYATALDRALAHNSSSVVIDALRAADARAQAWGAAARVAVAARRQSATVATDEALKRKQLMDAYRQANMRVQSLIESVRRHTARVTSVLSIAGSLLVALLVGLLGDVAIIRRSRTERAYREAQALFVATMQVVQDERQAHTLLKRHLERHVRTGQVVVLSRNNSADRLEPTTRVDDAAVAERLDGAAPSSCLAIRLGREHDRAERQAPLLDCEICGATAASVRCSPLLVGSEVIGSVLVTHQGTLAEQETTRMSESIAAAAPVLANLRNLAIAERRAATDSLTGLPNRRSVEDTLKRMIAQAARTAQPLSAIMIDLDHFKQLNDLHGHECGDEALASIGALLADCMRASDFAGRIGGEEFIVLAPTTDIAGAQVLAESLRRALGRQDPGPRDPVTASFGVASYPESAADGPGLLRMADRALYAAKERGRDRVEVASRVLTDDPDEAPATS